MAFLKSVGSFGDISVDKRLEKVNSFLKVSTAELNSADFRKKYYEL